MRIDPKTTLRVRWSKRERDVMYHSPNGPDGHWIHAWLTAARLPPGFDLGWPPPWPHNDRSFMRELDQRGYDVTTLRISVKRKAEPMPAIETKEGK